jgi:mTERF domain-containing protein
MTRQALFIRPSSQEHIKFLSSIGMDENDVVLTVSRLSQLFSLSVENSLRPKFLYLTNKLGGNVQTCVKFPAYFSLSLDQRIRPRHNFLERFSCAPDPFPMRALSENDTVFAKRASKTLEVGPHTAPPLSDQPDCLLIVHWCT